MSEAATDAGHLDRALARLDAGRLAGDLARLVRVPSPTGDERPALACLAGLCGEHGIPARLVRHDLDALRRHPDHPGEEAPRAELWGLRSDISGAGLRRLCLAAHLDVVGLGTEPWTRDPWAGTVADGAVHGRGAVDMKAGAVAALHAIAAVVGAADDQRPPCDLTLLAVSSEEDGGQGAFAALLDDDAYDACLIPEPTDFRVVCAHGGALTVRGVVRGISAHAAFRLSGRSAIDRYLPIHAALADLEAELNRDVTHPLMAELELPYPVVVGRLSAGDWSSQVPDRLEFEARIGVPVGTPTAAVRARVEAVVAEAAGTGPSVDLTWHGGRFAAAATDVDEPYVGIVCDAVGLELGAPARVAGIPYGADMRFFVERGIPCVLLGPPNSRLAHAVDEQVAVADVEVLARMLVRTIVATAALP